MSAADPRRRIPAVDRLLESDAFAALREGVGRERLRGLVEGVQEEVRARFATGAEAGGGAGAEPRSTLGADAVADPGWYAAEVARRLAAAEAPSLERVINATGVVLHTNLGRAPLAAAAQRALARLAAGYSNLEYDLEEGARGSRYDHCVALLRELTGAEDALVVNNNAAAVVLALNTLAQGRQAVVSRGEQVEIGGHFRIPEIIARSGAEMVEVGATNRTHAADYEAALGPRTGVLLKVHRSNFRLSGFTAEVGSAALVALGRGRGVPVVEDLGSGLLADPARVNLPDEPTPAASLAAGVDVVTMSGDKLLGGPQAGLVLGRADVVRRMRRNPLCRALRVDKLTLGALEATLALYREPERALREVPVLRMLTTSAAELRGRAEAFAARLRDAGVGCELLPGRSAVGGGAAPGAELETTLVAPDLAGRSPDAAADALRRARPPVVARIGDGRLVLDLRTVGEEEEPLLVAAVAAAGAP